MIPTFTPQAIGGILSGTMADEELRAFKPEDVRALKNECDRMVTRAGGAPRTGDPDARTVEHIASNFDKDRMGDRIDPRGWDLRTFRGNPLLLWGHRDHEPPIGRVLRVQKTAGEGGELMTVSRFHPAEKYAFADLIFKMVLDGDLPAVSVGFMPSVVERPANEEEATKLGVGRWGVVYRKQELLELSVVTVPANAAALAKKLKRFEDEHTYPSHVLRLVERYLEGDEPHRSVHRIAQPACEVVDDNEEVGATVDSIAQTAMELDAAQRGWTFTGGSDDLIPINHDPVVPGVVVQYYLVDSEGRHVPYDAGLIERANASERARRGLFGPDEITTTPLASGKAIEQAVERAVNATLPEVIHNAVRDGFERGVHSLLDQMSGETEHIPKGDGKGVSEQSLETSSSLDAGDGAAVEGDELWAQVLEDVERKLNPPG